MQAYILEWLNLLLRWTHLIVGIAWIGSSFYFVWLDAQLNRPPRDPESDRVAGDLWAVHGGGFYHAQKYHVAPQELPAPLHWFKWEAYSTWLSGFALLVVVYYVNADIYLIDAGVADISRTTAIAISIATLALGWLLYDGVCRSGLGDRGITVVGFSLLTAAAWGLSQVFSGRGTFMQIGAILGTLMAANVLLVIIPGQRELVHAKQRGEEPDPGPGLRGKQRSIHNNYMTLPVLFVMISAHHPMTYGHVHQWAILMAMFVIGGVVRHYFNLRNSGRHRPLLPLLALFGTVAVAALIAPPAPAPSAVRTPDESAPTATLASVRSILERRCNMCHSATPTHPSAPVAPNGVVFDSDAEVQRWAARIHERAVTTRTMPLGNLTGMTEEERAAIARWFQQL